jgi:ASPIC/UnbV protein/VCBS repeat protein/type IX secretion system substrate protein
MKQTYLTFLLVFSLLKLQSQIAFTDVTATAGIAFNSEKIESLAWGDYDNDGDEDLFLSIDGVNKLMRNDGSDIFTDVSVTAGFTVTAFSTGCAFGDLDNDGDLDLFVVTSSGGGEFDLLYENLGAASSYTFQSIASGSSGITDTNSVRGMAFLDYNRDGLLDIYINTNSSDIVYKNLGNLQFQEVSTSIGISSANATEVGVAPTDINNDGWIDIFTGNRSSVSNKLFLNDGTGNFTDITVSAGIDEVGLGMGVFSFDYDNDLDMDLYWTTWPGDTEPFQPNALYQNQGDNTFLNKTIESATLDETGWGISCNAGDIDNDRLEDFFISNGFSATSTQSILYRNTNGILFEDITTAILGDITWDARGVAFADYDNDGDLDICLTGGAGVDTKLWRNDSTNSNNWVSLILEGVTGNRSAIGARIEVTANSLTTVKEVSGGVGRGSFNSLPVEFGLGNATTIDNVKIVWPNGVTENFNAISINQIQNIKEGNGTLSTNDISLDNITLNVYPNPFKNKLNLDLSQFEDSRSIKIYNILGVLIYEEDSHLEDKITIEINNNYSGLLLLYVESNNVTVVHKIMKQ